MIRTILVLTLLLQFQQAAIAQNEGPFGALIEGTQFSKYFCNMHSGETGAIPVPPQLSDKSRLQIVVHIDPADGSIFLNEGSYIGLLKAIERWYRIKCLDDVLAGRVKPPVSDNTYIVIITQLERTQPLNSQEWRLSGQDWSPNNFVGASLRSQRK